MSELGRKEAVELVGIVERSQAHRAVLEVLLRQHLISIDDHIGKETDPGEETYSIP